MTYLPRMTNRIDGFSVETGHHRRYWNGMVADVWKVACHDDAGGRYISHDPRLFILLDRNSSEEAVLRLSDTGGRTIHNGAIRALHYIPAGLEMTLNLNGIHSLCHLDLHFDADILLKRLGPDVPRHHLDEPRYLMQSPRLLALSDMIAEEVRSAHPLHDLYGESLVTALIVETLAVPGAGLQRKRSRLAAWQLRRACDFITEHALRTIRLDELSTLTGLSPSYFSHAFKASTGLSPHQWQMRERIERAKQQLKNPAIPLIAIAEETGFADPAHFSRSFRRAVGLSPSQWRRQSLL
ncbi:AraC family transcriptional regulator [Allorhizobium sp. BGMRC 0089]|uniref:helix-turn-helix transcriptional regulator n=1 Tax=Allorhizobium sonneratiae TaxID=2934936 RepID=UPI002033307F|nr:AraC family transcriptional regulator [Allorhizobium sonneratiae]MCM2294616.1 AraC family transcriptional regulator [Allorhizobium sonneratiae]